MAATKKKLKKAAKKVVKVLSYEEREAAQREETSKRELPKLRELLKSFVATTSDTEKTSIAKSIKGLCDTTHSFYKNEEYKSIEKVAIDHLEAVKEAARNKEKAELEAKKKELVGKKATFKEDYCFMGAHPFSSGKEGRFINKGTTGEVIDVISEKDYDSKPPVIYALVRIPENSITHIRIYVKEKELTFS